MCQQRKLGPGMARLPLHQVPTSFPNERWHMDVLTVKPVSKQGNHLILVVVDHFTRWTEALPLSNHRAETIAHAVVREVFCRFGSPYVIHTDQGADFESELFKEMCKLLNITKTRTSPYRPQSDGMPERFNRTLLSLLSMFVSQCGSDWEDHLPYAMAAYRSSVHSTTGYSPNFMVFARELPLPLDVTFGPPPDQVKSVCRVEFVQQLQAGLLNAHNLVLDSCRAAWDIRNPAMTLYFETGSYT